MPDKQFKNILVAALVIVALYFFSEIILPIIFALIIALALLKPSQWLERKGVPRGVSAIVLLIIPMILFAGITWFYYTQFNSFLASLPDIPSRSEEAVEEFSEAVDDSVNVSITDEFDRWRESAGSILQSGNEFISSTFSTFTSLLSLVAIIPIYVFFLLISRNYLKRFIDARFSEKEGKKWFSFFSKAKEAMLGYFKGLALVILFVGILNSLGLYLLGLEYAVLLGTFAAFLIVLPYIGVIIGAIIPVLVTLVTTDSLLYPLLVLGLFGFVQFLEGNIITPKLMSETINLNPLAIILFLVFMGFMGGLLGFVIAVPTLALLKQALSESEEYKSFAILLGSD